MTTDVQFLPLEGDHNFGARVVGLTKSALSHEPVRERLRAGFEEHGLLVFKDVEPSSEMHVAISGVFGPLKEHPVPTVARVDGDLLPGVIDMHQRPGEGSIVEIDAEPLMNWLPWHFDHCYNDELNLAGVLRALTIPPEGGLTGFADGVDLYASLSPELRGRIENANILYTLDVVLDNLRYGRPAQFRVLNTRPNAARITEQAKLLPRALHPAVWQLPSGKQALHISPWMAVGIEGQEDAQGAALLQAVCDEMLGAIKPYFHKWSTTDMLIWDNRRMLHSVSGNSPDEARRMQRTTIRGDYGLGRFEGGRSGDRLLEMTV